jgi:hypothetical protein
VDIASVAKKGLPSSEEEEKQQRNKMKMKNEALGTKGHQWVET